MLLQNIEFATRHSYKASSGTWLYDVGATTATNEYGVAGTYNGGAPTIFVEEYVLGGGGAYCLAWGYDKLINGDSDGGTHANPAWFTTQAGATKYWQSLSYA